MLLSCWDTWQYFAFCCCQMICVYMKCCCEVLCCETPFLYVCFNLVKESKKSQGEIGQVKAALNSHSHQRSCRISLSLLLSKCNGKMAAWNRQQHPWPKYSDDKCLPEMSRPWRYRSMMKRAFWLGHLWHPSPVKTFWYLITKNLYCSTSLA